MSKRTILKGTLILTIAGIATKLLGFYNRIFLTRLIGVIELGKYQLVFPIYMFVFAFCSQGISTTLTKQVSYYIGSKNEEKADYIFRISILISVSLSLFLASIIYGASDFISLTLLKNTDCSTLLRIITLAIPFVALKSCINFYFIGIDKPMFHGLSHFIEQVIRIGSAYILSLCVITEKVNAQLAVIAVVIGEISATFIAIIIYYVNKHNKQKNNETNNKILHSEKNNKKLSRQEKHKTLKYFANDAIPITINNLILTLFSTFEAIIMPAMLYYYYNDSDMALETFGIITGIVIPFILFPATITTSLSTMLLPAVSYANAQHDTRTINKALKNCILFCILLGLCASAGFFFLGEPICTFAFKSKEAGILLRKLCLLCPLIYTSGNLTAILNGIDKSFFALICNIISISIRITFIFLLVPHYGLNAYAMGMFVSYTTINLLMLLGIRSFKAL
ncbi:MAG: polysaccharide biosynthesis protein [Lachnospiraceae bacterium]|nr:polysaccharide biosynthesis protein [Lachnospiraceae bacterium]